MAALFPTPVMQFFDANGNPLVGGKLYTYAAGTTTPLATYTDSTGATANTNPVILNSRGEAAIWVGTANYYMVLLDSDNVQAWTADNVGGSVSLAALAASGGSALIGFIAAGTGAVTRTVQSKLRETVSVKDYGAVGDGVTDDTAAIQACINAVEASTYGGVVYLPTGTYKVTSNLTVTWPKLCVLRGDGSQLTFIWDYRTSVGTAGVVYYNSTAAAGGDNAYMATWTGGFSIVKKVNFTIVTGLVITTVGTGKGLYAAGVVGGTFQDIWVTGYEYNIYMVDCLGFAMRDLYLNQCNYGLYMAGYVSLSGPNVGAIDHMIASACGVWGLYVNGGTVQVYDCTISDCGTMATTSGGACIITDTTIGLPKTTTISNSWFERNRGSADIYAINNYTVPVSLAAANNLFSRLDSTYYTTNNIYVLNSGNSALQLESNSNGFAGYGTYVANASRLYIAVGGTYAALVYTSYIGDSYASATETPVLIPTAASNFSSLGIGTSTLAITSSGSNLSFGGQFAVVPTLGIAPGTTNTYLNGGPSLRWSNVYSVLGNYSGAITWGAYTMAVPTGSTSTFLRNDGTWTTPSAGGTPTLNSVTGAGNTTTANIIYQASGGSSTAFVGNSTGNWLSLNGVAEVVPSGGIAPVTNNTYVLGSTSFRWANTWSVLADISGVITWNTYAIPAPLGSTTTYLRNDGTWAAPAGTLTSTNYTYTGTGTGFTTSPTATISYTRIGDIITMDTANISGTSNAATFTITGGTTNMRPATDKQCYVGIVNNGVSQMGSVIIKTTGVIEVYSNVGGVAFTAIGTKGIYGSSFSYTTV